MPNHVISRITLRGEEAAVAAALDSLVDAQEGGVDFGRLLPMPEDLDIEDRSDARMVFEALGDGWRRIATYAWVPEEAKASRESLLRFLRERFGEEAFALGERYQRNLERYGHITWYGWRCEHWGTKWNAYRSRVVAREPGLAVVELQTAWSEPEPVVALLAERHPGVEVLHRFADELLNFCGWRRYVHGTLVEESRRPGAWLAELGFSPEGLAEALEEEAS